MPLENCPLNEAYFHFTCPIIRQLTAAKVTKLTLSKYRRIIIEEFNACLKRLRFCEKIKYFTLISNVCHQNIEGKIVMFVTSF